ncbi:hypothetical protein C8J56DRAFT_900291 [Mycena floridula]|nr:hypothetical protein C8J56DRAFT_900291 [Mycena floridula]
MTFRALLGKADRDEYLPFISAQFVGITKGVQWTCIDSFVAMIASPMRSLYLLNSRDLVWHQAERWLKKMTIKTMLGEQDEEQRKLREYLAQIIHGSVERKNLTPVPAKQWGSGLNSFTGTDLRSGPVRFMFLKRHSVLLGVQNKAKYLDGSTMLDKSHSVRGYRKGGPMGSNRLLVTMVPSGFYLRVDFGALNEEVSSGKSPLTVSEDWSDEPRHLPCKESIQDGPECKGARTNLNAGHSS